LGETKPFLDRPDASAVGVGCVRGEKRAGLVQNPQWSEELRRFRAEAEEVLGIEKK
jgi:hypothetical protein